LFIWTGGWGGSLCVVNVMWIDLDPLAFILQFLNQFWIESRLVCSLYEAITGSLCIVLRIVGKGCCGGFWWGWQVCSV
jgi:hypothetical protein